MTPQPIINLSSGVQAWSFKHKLIRSVWIVSWTLFGKLGPRRFSPIRCWLLRLFGAEIGRKVLFCGNVDVLMPWNLKVGDGTAIAEYVNIYNFAQVEIGQNSSISKGCWICTGTHDYTHPHMPLTWASINIGSECWVAADVFIAPGVCLGNGSVIGARSVVTKDMPEWTVCAGHPCKPIKPRTLKDL